MFKRDFLKAAGAALAFSGPAFAAGKTWKVTVAQMPVVSESRDKGVFIDLLKSMERACGDRFEVQVVPFARSIGDVADRKADFHWPLLQQPGSPGTREKFDYASPVLYHVNFVLYTAKNSSVSLASLGKSKIETDAAHVEYFDFPVVGSSNLEGSIKRVDAGRLDGLIFADVAIDPIVKATKLSNLKRTLYKRMPVMFVLPKGERGGPTDKFLTATVDKMKASGEWAKGVAALDAAYDDWQP
jgi:polar amino acid transport system substrate-binding protein